MYGAVATTPGVLSIFVLSVRHSRKTSSELTRIWASKSITFWRSSRSKPVITEITRINTVTPSITPRIEISVMIERNVRFGFRYRNARNRLNGSFNWLLGWRQTQLCSTARGSLFERVRLKFFKGDELERRTMRCFKVNRGRAVVIKRVFPARDAHAPFVTRFESRKSVFWMRRDQVIPIKHRKIQKLLSDLHANGMLAEIFRTCSAKTVAVESRQRIATTTFQ